LLLLLTALLGVAAVVYAQLEGGERGVAPIDSSGSYEVGGIHVDVAGKTADEARIGGWREAQRKGWKMLWGRVNGQPSAAAPGLPDSTLDSIVGGIVVEDEEIGTSRYIARLGVLFDRARAGQLLGVRGQTMRSPPMLVIPVIWSGATPQTFEMRTEWQKAWARFRSGGSPIDYVRPSGTGSDPLLLNVAQARRPGRTWWRMLLDQYGAADGGVAAPCLAGRPRACLLHRAARAGRRGDRDLRPARREWRGAPRHARRGRPPHRRSLFARAAGREAPAGSVARDRGARNSR
jgi:hypothetical protein